MTEFHAPIGHAHFAIFFAFRERVAPAAGGIFQALCGE
jgi:hypothetical protein